MTRSISNANGYKKAELALESVFIHMFTLTNKVDDDRDQANRMVAMQQYKQIRMI